MKKKNDPILFARMPAKEIEGIRKKCKQNDITLSQLIRKLLRAWDKYDNDIFKENV